MTDMEHDINKPKRDRQDQIVTQCKFLSVKTAQAF